jgi:hypothetical protein
MRECNHCGKYYKHVYLCTDIVTQTLQNVCVKCFATEKFELAGNLL